MVYHYTNFIYETNGWWLRRVRPVWMGATFIGIYYLLDRYYFFGKTTARAQRATDPEIWKKRAQDNKRDWGYGVTYKPTLAISRKKEIMEAMGSNSYP